MERKSTPLSPGINAFARGVGTAYGLFDRPAGSRLYTLKGPQSVRHGLESDAAALAGDREKLRQDMTVAIARLIARRPDLQEKLGSMKLTNDVIDEQEKENING